MKILLKSLIFLNIIGAISCVVMMSSLMHLADGLIASNHRDIGKAQIILSKFGEGVKQEKFKEISDVFIYAMETNNLYIKGVREIMEGIAIIIICSVVISCCILYLSRTRKANSSS